MINLDLITGAPIPIEEMRTEMHQPTIYEISLLGEEEFNYVTSIIKITKEDFIKENIRMYKKKAKENEEEVGKEIIEEIKKELEMFYTSDFSVLLQLLTNEKNKNSFLSFLYLIFPGAKNIEISLADEEIVFYFDDTNIVTIMEYEWETIKDKIIYAFSYGDKDEDNEEFNPAGKEAQAIVDKIKEARERRNKNKKGEFRGGTQIGTMSSILSTISGVPINDIVQLTFAQTVIQLDREMEMKEYDSILSTSTFGLPEGTKLPDWLKTV